MTQSSYAAIISQYVKDDECVTVTPLGNVKMKNMPKSPVSKMLDKHSDLTHSTDVKVVSHVQRQQDDWYVNTIMIDGISVPFIYKRKKPYRSLIGARVNLTYYPTSKQVAGFEMEMMKVVRIRVA